MAVLGRWADGERGIAEATMRSACRSCRHAAERPANLVEEALPDDRPPRDRMWGRLLVTCLGELPRSFARKCRQDRRRASLSESASVAQFYSVDRSETANEGMREANPTISIRQRNAQVGGSFVELDASSSKRCWKASLPWRERVGHLALRVANTMQGSHRCRRGAGMWPTEAGAPREAGRRGTWP
jgi:hypothetical protein